MAFMGLLVMSGQGTTPSAQAQASECPDGAVVRCLTIVKEAEVEDDADVTFDFGIDISGDTDDFTLEAGGSAAFELLDGETHSVTEAELDGWSLMDIDCSDAEGVEVAEDEDSGTVTVEVTATEEEDASVTCTFTNEQTATPTATATATATGTAEAEDDGEEEDDGTTTPTTTSSGNSATPVVPTPIAPTPRPPASTVESGGTISPPSTGSAGLK
jgi:hypothetical protein